MFILFLVLILSEVRLNSGYIWPSGVEKDPPAPIIPNVSALNQIFLVLCLVKIVAESRNMLAQTTPPLFLYFLKKYYDVYPC